MPFVLVAGQLPRWAGVDGNGMEFQIMNFITSTYSR